MREISFRAWDKVNKKMIYSPMAICSGDGGWVLFTAEVENMSCYNAIHPIQQYEIMQYTGLKDRLGKEIWEGDIIKCYNGIVNQYFNSVVKWEITDIQDDISDFPLEVSGFIIGSLSEVEIIGNIYEHPHLVAQESKS